MKEENKLMINNLFVLNNDLFIKLNDTTEYLNGSYPNPLDNLMHNIEVSEKLAYLANSIREVNIEILNLMQDKQSALSQKQVNEIMTVIQNTKHFA